MVDRRDQQALDHAIAVLQSLGWHVTKGETTDRSLRITAWKGKPTGVRIVPAPITPPEERPSPILLTGWEAGRAWTEESIRRYNEKQRRLAEEAAREFERRIKLVKAQAERFLEEQRVRGAWVPPADASLAGIWETPYTGEKTWVPALPAPIALEWEEGQEIP